MYFLLSFILLSSSANFQKLKPPPEFWCNDLEKSSEVEILPEFTGLESQRNSIFFIETVCQSKYPFSQLIDIPFGCAVESAARKNMNSDIYILFLSKTLIVRDRFENPYRNILYNTLQSYPNIYFRFLNFESFLNGTILEGSFQMEQLLESEYSFEYTHHMIRWLLLWKYGGTVMDLDLISVRSVENLDTNCVGFQVDGGINTAFLKFENPGNVFVSNYLNWVKNRFETSEHVGFGSHFVRMVKRRCQADAPLDMNYRACKGLYVYNDAQRNPIIWKTDELFKRVHTFWDALRVVENARLLRIWNRKTLRQREIDSRNREVMENPFEFLVEDLCPATNYYFKAT